jgi:hypothetical protein
MHAPYVNPPFYADTSLIEPSLEKALSSYGAIKELRLSGGEVWFHPDIIKIMQITAKFKQHFEILMIITNGSYVPKMEILKAMSELDCGLIIRIDDYGKLSKKIDELKMALSMYNIAYEIRPYTKEIQEFGGWLDLGDLSFVGGTEEELKERFINCEMFRGCNQVMDGIGYPCPVIFFCKMLKNVQPRKVETVNYLSNDDIADIKLSIKNWDKLPYFEACKYCKGYDTRREDRIIPAEQIK